MDGAAHGRRAIRRHLSVTVWSARLLSRVTRALGFRGAALLLFGLAFYGLAATIQHTHTPPELFYASWPIWTRVLLWAGSATIAVAAAVIHRPRWQGYGFGALFLGPVERCLAYLFAAFQTGEGQWLPRAIVWALCACLVALMAAWPEPPRYRYRRPA